jgi:hypothetical protein
VPTTVGCRFASQRKLAPVCKSGLPSPALAYHCAGNSHCAVRQAARNVQAVHNPIRMQHDRAMDLAAWLSILYRRGKKLTRRVARFKRVCGLIRPSAPNQQHIDSGDRLIIQGQYATGRDEVWNRASRICVGLFGLGCCATLTGFSVARSATRATPIAIGESEVPRDAGEAIEEV